MALPLLAVAVAGVLLLLLAALAALVKLVLWLTLRNTLLALATAALYCFVAARRRRIAKGFYSCSQLPCAHTTTDVVAAAAQMTTHEQTADAVGTSAVARTLQTLSSAPATDQQTTTTPATAVPPRTANDSSKSGATDAPVAPTDGVTTTATTTPAASLSDSTPSLVCRRSMQLPSPLPLKTVSSDSVASPSLSSTESEDDEELALSLSLSHSASSSRVSSPARVAPAPSAATRKIRPRSSSSSSGFSVTNRRRLVGSINTGADDQSSPARPPQSYHHTPPRSVGAVPSGVTARSRSRAATVTTSASGHSALLPRNAAARRSGASERELMQEKMASDGYWIGDFRPERVARRSFLGGSSSAQSSPRAV